MQTFWRIHLQTIFSFSVALFKMSLMISVFLSQPMKQWDKSFASHSITWAFGTKSHQSFISSKLWSLFWAGTPFSHSAFYRNLPAQYQALLAFTSVDWNSLTAWCLAGRIDESITFATRKISSPHKRRRNIWHVCIQTGHRWKRKAVQKTK